MFLSRCISREHSEDTLQRLFRESRIECHCTKISTFELQTVQRAEVKRVVRCEGMCPAFASASPPRICMSSKRISPKTNTNFTRNSPLYHFKGFLNPSQVFLHTAGKHFSFRVHKRTGIYSECRVFHGSPEIQQFETEFPATHHAVNMRQRQQVTTAMKSALQCLQALIPPAGRAPSGRKRTRRTAAAADSF